MTQHSQQNSARNRVSQVSQPTRRVPRVIYRPESQMRHPMQLFRTMWRDLLASRELAWQLMIRDISAQYRQSFLGVAWAIIPPIVAAAGFTFAKDSGVVNIGDTDLPYPAYVMFSTALWQTFVEAITLPMQIVGQAKMMLAKISFPREALILSGIGQVFFNFAFKLILIIGMFLWFRIPVTLSVILAPVALIHLVMLGSFFGVLLAPLSLLYRDFTKGVAILTGLWLFLTPVIYPIPQKGGMFGLIVKFNPVTPLLVTTRELATKGVISDPQGFWIASLISIGGLLFAWLTYRLAMPFVIERISS
ncbi:MAG: ABC transporter permease [Cyanobacteria bacterium CRU_2_1]|nr:ABC transporter permease [Cyanobacteria bacterium CRU_2_1]